MRTKAILTACVLCLVAFARPGAAQDLNWKLLETTTYGAGGFWENGQTVRIDRSYKPGTFSYERKVTAGESLSVFTSKGVFSTLKNEYAPGESMTVTVSVSSSGELSAAPDHVYGRVTLLTGDPEWTKSNWASHKIPGAGSVDGQFTASGGSYMAGPAGAEALTLSKKAPTTGDRMAIVFSCNGRDVLHLYGREGIVREEPAEAPAAKVDDTSRKDTAESIETAEDEQAPKEKPAREKKVREKADGETGGLTLQPLAPKVKLLVLGVLLLAAIFDLLYMFSKPKE